MALDRPESLRGPLARLKRHALLSKRILVVDDDPNIRQILLDRIKPFDAAQLREVVEPCFRPAV